MRRHGIATLAVVAGFFVFFSKIGLAAADSNRLIVSKIDMLSGGQRIRIDKYEQTQNVSRPAILVLHGAGGILLDGPEMRRVARRLAEAGNAVYLVHYFNRTGTIFGRDAGMQKNFPVWLETIRDASTSVQKAQGNSTPVGIYGYSLGAFLALAAASDNAAVGAVVEQAGGIWNGKTERIRRMPPVLTVHGKADQRVRFQKYAGPLMAVLRERGTAFETLFFPGEAHGFTQTAMAEVREAAVKFFRKHLRPSHVAGNSRNEASEY